MIIDARRANLRFKDPPGVKLCSSEAFSRIEVSEEVENISMGTADVKDCFYRFRIRRELSEYFALPSVCKSEVYDLLGPEYDKLGMDQYIAPCFAALPMVLAGAYIWHSGSTSMLSV